MSSPGIVDGIEQLANVVDTDGLTPVLVGDKNNNAIRVNSIAGGISLPNYDYAKLTQDATHDVWTFKTGGAAGTLVATVTITYTDATKAVIDTVVRT